MLIAEKKKRGGERKGTEVKNKKHYQEIIPNHVTIPEA